MRVPRDLDDERLAEIDAVLKHLRQVQRDTNKMIDALLRQRACETAAEGAETH